MTEFDSHRRGDRLVSLGDLRLNVSLLERRRAAGKLETNTLSLGVRQYCNSLGITGDTPADRQRAREKINWDTVASMKGQDADALPTCLATFTGQGVKVVVGTERIIRAFLDNVLTLEVEVIDQIDLRSLVLIPKTEEALAKASSDPSLATDLGDEEEEEDDLPEDAEVHAEPVLALNRFITPIDRSRPMNDLAVPLPKKKPKKAQMVVRTKGQEFVVPVVPN